MRVTFLPVRKVGDRLVVQHELAFVDRVAQVGRAND